MARCPLVCHPDTPCTALAALGAQIALTDDFGWEVQFVGVGSPGQLSWPEPAPLVHTDGLWRTTCFELFFALEGDAYSELNLSPSGAFAAYHFDHYRTGMRPFAMPAPRISVEIGHERFALTAKLAEDCLPWNRTGRIGIAAVIEDRTGAISYWALAHPPGRPDFHHRDCFACQLPSLGAA